jgi:hypothetical protein
LPYIDEKTIKFKYDKYLSTFILKIMNKINGTKEEEKVVIIDLNDKGPVIIFFLNKK